MTFEVNRELGMQRSAAPSYFNVTQPDQCCFWWPECTLQHAENEIGVHSDIGDAVSPYHLEYIPRNTYDISSVCMCTYIQYITH